MKKKYLNLGQKMAYGSGDMACNFCYSVVSSFMLIYLTDAVGLKAGIIGTLMLVSRIFDGISDVIAGSIIDRTHSKLGRARPWMFWTIIPTALCQIFLFSIPKMSVVLQYAWFFVFYTLLNAVFYTLNNVAYSSLSAFITPQKEERVQLGVFRFIFSSIAGVISGSATMSMVRAFGGGTKGWRGTALVYAGLFAVICFLCATVCKELPEEELYMGATEKKEEKLNLVQVIKYLVKNKFFLEQLLLTILYNVVMTITGAVGIYYMKYVLGNEVMLGVFSLVQLIPLVIGLSITPFLVSKWGIYKTNLIGLTIAAVAGIPFAYFGYHVSIVPMMIFFAISWFGKGAQIGNSNALIAEIAAYSTRTQGVHIEASMFSCSSMGIKLGAGFGTILTGWMLEAVHYNGQAEIQSQSVISMISFLYTVLPLVCSVIVLLISYVQKVEKANLEYDKLHNA